jgi:hypothetical protein
MSVFQTWHHWRCQSCNHVVTIAGPTTDAREPTGCGNCEGGGAWDYLGFNHPTLSGELRRKSVDQAADTYGYGDAPS